MVFKWYMLAIRGSLNNAQDYVNTTVGGGSQYSSPKAHTFQAASKNIIKLNVRPKIGKNSEKRPKRKRTQTSQPECQKGTCPAQDSRQMNEFFREVRYRELKGYYAKMIVAARRRTSINPSRMCFDCGLLKPKAASRDIRGNVYCFGPETMCSIVN